MRRLLLPVVCVAVVLVGAACVRITRGAIRNDSRQPVTVLLTDAEGQSVTFPDVAPGTTTTFVQLPFGKLDGVTVKVTGGTAPAGTVKLEYTRDNVIAVAEDAAPSVQAQENPDNRFW
jgi:hypothetical protein